MRYLVNISYDGTLFYGSQKQKDKRTVLGEVEKVLSKINNKPLNFSPFGRNNSKSALT